MIMNSYCSNISLFEIKTVNNSLMEFGAFIAPNREDSPTPHVKLFPQREFSCFRVTRLSLLNIFGKFLIPYIQSHKRARVSYHKIFPPTSLNHSWLVEPFFYLKERIFSGNRPIYCASTYLIFKRVSDA